MLAVRAVTALAATAAVFLTACGGSSDTVVKLDGSPRRPDIEGVVRTASIDGITFEGGRKYRVSKELISFSTYTREPVALSSTLDAYVQAGVDGNTVVWLSKIGPVSTDDAGHRTVQYQGDLVDIDGRSLVFKDGTVLRLGAGLKPPEDPFGPTYIVIDADKKVVQGATFAPTRSKK